MAPLAAGRRVLALDLPGFGASEGPPRALGTEALATFLRAWLAGAGVERAALPANSMGARSPSRRRCGGRTPSHPERLLELVLPFLADGAREAAGP